jgi:hypothetical protein
MTANGEPNGVAELRRLGADVVESDPAAKARARARLDRAIQRELAGPRLPAFPRWGAVAAAIVALSLFASLLVGGDRPEPNPALLELSSVASQGTAPAIPAGSFVYTRSKVRTTSTSTGVTNNEQATIIVESLRETWIAEDGSGLLLLRQIDPSPGEIDRVEGGPDTLRFVSLNGLPTEPQALRDRIRGSPYLDFPDDDIELLSSIAALLRDSYASSAHREALFRIVARLPGVVVAEGEVDPEGRAATAVSLTTPARSILLLFDPETSRLLAEFDERTDGRLSEAVYLETAVVSEVGERPEAGAS